MTMLSATNVSFAFGNQPVLDAVSVECMAGETIGIVGRSGCGKTTLLRILAGYLDAHTGSMTIDGMHPARAAAEQKIGFIFQAPTLMPWLTVRQNVSLPLRLRRAQHRHTTVGFSTDEQAVEAAMAHAHIAHAADRFPHELSGGMQTRASIARAIAYHPLLLLADEPLSALDDIVKETLYQDLQTITADRCTATVLVTHNLTEAVLLCDRVYVLGGQSREDPSRIVHCEEVKLPRPRTIDALGNESFLAARRHLREALI